MSQVLAIIGSALLIIIGLWKHFSRVGEERRKLADEARDKLDKAHKDSNKSDLLDAWDRARRMR